MVVTERRAWLAALVTLAVTPLVVAAVLAWRVLEPWPFVVPPCSHDETKLYLVNLEAFCRGRYIEYEHGPENDGGL